MFDREAEKSNNLHYFVTVLYPPYQVFIPIEKFTDTDLEAMWKRFTDNGSVKTLDETIKTYLEARIGAEVDFIITNLPEDGSLETALFVGGDRVEALRRKRIRFWYGTQKDGQPLIREGDKAQARIVSVIRGGILIEIFGVRDVHPCARALVYPHSGLQAALQPRALPSRSPSLTSSATKRMTTPFTSTLRQSSQCPTRVSPA